MFACGEIKSQRTRQNAWSHRRRCWEWENVRVINMPRDQRVAWKSNICHLSPLWLLMTETSDLFTSTTAPPPPPHHVVINTHIYVCNWLSSNLSPSSMCASPFVISSSSSAHLMNKMCKVLCVCAHISLHHWFLWSHNIHPYYISSTQPCVWAYTYSRGGWGGWWAVFKLVSIHLCISYSSSSWTLSLTFSIHYGVLAVNVSEKETERESGSLEVRWGEGGKCLARVMSTQPSRHTCKFSLRY